jgi:hypothetical protein
MNPDDLEIEHVGVNAGGEQEYLVTIPGTGHTWGVFIWSMGTTNLQGGQETWYRWRAVARDHPRLQTKPKVQELEPTLDAALEAAKRYILDEEQLAE